MIPIDTQRLFIAGTEWLYYVIHVGPQTSDRFLTDSLAPQADALIKSNAIDKWFFIRYKDEKGMHLRVRFHLEDPQQIGTVIGSMRAALAPYIQNRLVSDVSINTYKREIERYGATTIEDFETLFFISSELAIAIISRTDNSSEKKWLLGMRAIDVFLSGWEYDIPKKKQLLEELKNGFGREFGIDKFARKHLNRKYRDNRTEIENMVGAGDPDFERVFEKFRQGNSKPIASIQKKVALLEEVDTDDLLKDYLGSYIHMLCNRLFPSKQRLSECILYDLLFEYYYSRQARLGIQKKELQNQNQI